MPALQSLLPATRPSCCSFGLDALPTPTLQISASVPPLRHSSDPWPGHICFTIRTPLTLLPGSQHTCHHVCEMFVAYCLPSMRGFFHAVSSAPGPVPCSDSQLINVRWTTRTSLGVLPLLPFLIAGSHGFSSLYLRAKNVQISHYH